jgi:hypothetical protein
MHQRAVLAGVDIAFTISGGSAASVELFFINPLSARHQPLILYA